MVTKIKVFNAQNDELIFRGSGVTVDDLKSLAREHGIEISDLNIVGEEEESGE